MESSSPQTHASKTRDRENLKHDPYYFDRSKRVKVAHEMVLQLKRRLHLRVHAICVQKWHSHVVTGATRHQVSEVAKCAKDAATWFLRVGRPIWGADFDKRYCFDDRSARNRIDYVERHNLEDGLPARVVPILDDYRGFAN